uniref:Mpv17-like protein n=1 Tax=Glossina morsitans morsitans TaxID=37546 RepID=A0A1B0G7G6_GLOMM
MSRLLKAASKLLQKHPFLTNSGIYGCLYVGAEYCQQLLSKKILVHRFEAEKNEIDYPTIGRYAVVGTFAYAPSLYMWYNWLDGRYPGTLHRTIVKKLILDQCILTPYLLCVFYVGLALLESADNKFEELRLKFVPTFKVSCMFWLPAQTFNFLIIPPRFRVIYMGVCGFMWANVLCWFKRQPQ